MVRSSYHIKRTVMGQLPFGADLYNGLTQIVQEENISLGRITALGATTFAKVAFYSQSEKKYLPLEFPSPMEILSCFGNVSLRDAKPFVHVHLVLSDIEGKTFSGHLLPDTILFACEVFIDEFEGEQRVREYDERTGLYLWKGECLL
ncbi:MAG: DUF296 domain-containing protein [Ignavibacteriales bacterium]|nr:DUF296 domain-containing protein [Ignavibacteriales bacterium]